MTILLKKIQPPRQEGFPHARTQERIHLVLQWLGVFGHSKEPILRSVAGSNGLKSLLKEMAVSGLISMRKQPGLPDGIWMLTRQSRDATECLLARRVSNADLDAVDPQHYRQQMRVQEEFVRLKLAGDHGARTLKSVAYILRRTRHCRDLAHWPTTGRPDAVFYDITLAGETDTLALYLDLEQTSAVRLAKRFESIVSQSMKFPLFRSVWVVGGDGSQMQRYQELWLKRVAGEGLASDELRSALLSRCEFVPANPPQSQAGP